MKKIQDAEIRGKKVLLRVDYNVPIEDGKITGDSRIRESLPTIQYLLDQGAKEIIIVTHLGKPEGKVVLELSLWPIANHLAKLLSLDVNFPGPQDQYFLSEKIILLENLRFSKGEEENDSQFARNLSSQGDLFVNDAFGTCHRAHASTAGVADFLPAFAGLLVQREVAELQKILQGGEKPFTLILGGAKIADKLPVVKNLIGRADNFLVGGAIASTFLSARRHYLGKSLVEPDSFREANVVWQNLMDDPKRNLYLPEDLVLSKSIEEPEDMKIVKTGDLLGPNFEQYAAVDIGPKTIENFKKVISASKTIFWNGNMGISEVSDFANGTNEIAQAVISSDAQIVIGGGDTVAAIENILSENRQQLTDNIFLSTGGGATLEFLAGKDLPGLKALE